MLNSKGPNIESVANYFDRLFGNCCLSSQARTQGRGGGVLSKKKAIELIKKSSQCRITYCCYTYQISELFRYHILRTDNLTSAQA